jgi:hypothetical protein
MGISMSRFLKYWTGISLEDGTRLPSEAYFLFHDQPHLTSYQIIPILEFLRLLQQRLDFFQSCYVTKVRHSHQSGHQSVLVELTDSTQWHRAYLLVRQICPRRGDGFPDPASLIVDTRYNRIIEAQTSGKPQTTRTMTFLPGQLSVVEAAAALVATQEHLSKYRGDPFSQCSWFAQGFWSICEEHFQGTVLYLGIKTRDILTAGMVRSLTPRILPIYESTYLMCLAGSEVSTTVHPTGCGG